MSEWSHLFAKEEPAQEGMFISTKKSREKVTKAIVDIDRALQLNIAMCQKAIPLLEDYFKHCTARIYNETERERESDVAKAFREAATKLDYDRATDDELRQMSKAYIKNWAHKRYNKADFRNQGVADAELALLQKCAEGGEYSKKLEAINEKMQKLAEPVSQPGFWDKYKGHLNVNMLAVWVDEWNWFNGQLILTKRDSAKVTANAPRLVKATEAFSAMESLFGGGRTMVFYETTFPSKNSNVPTAENIKRHATIEGLDSAELALKRGMHVYGFDIDDDKKTITIPPKDRHYLTEPVHLYSYRVTNARPVKPYHGEEPSIFMHHKYEAQYNSTISDVKDLQTTTIAEIAKKYGYTIGEKGNVEKERRAAFKSAAAIAQAEVDKIPKGSDLDKCGISVETSPDEEFIDNVDNTTDLIKIDMSPVMASGLTHYNGDADAKAVDLKNRINAGLAKVMSGKFKCYLDGDKTDLLIVLSTTEYINQEKLDSD